MNSSNKTLSHSQNNFEIEFSNFLNDEESENEAEEIEELDQFEETTFNDLSTFKTYDIENVLKSDEKLIIEKCTDENLKKLLILNRAKYTKLIKLFKTIKDLLAECQQNIKNKIEYIQKIKNTNPTTVIPIITKVAAPYFKDKRSFCSPFNEDALQKRNNKEFSLYDHNRSPTKWTSIDCDNFLRIVQFNYHFNKQKELNKKISYLKTKIEKTSSDETGASSELIQQLETELDGLGEPEEVDFPPRYCEEYIDWFRISDFFLKGRHTPLECKSFWNNYAHPTINKSPWTAEEDSHIKELVKKYNCQDWDKIADELDSDRSGFSTCLHYLSVLDEKYKKEKFTKEEDQMLLDVVKKFKIGPQIQWVRVCSYFPNRSRVQLYHRYYYYLAGSKGHIRKFTEAEDVLLLILVNRFGKRFRKCAEYVPFRTCMQLKNRYNSNLEQNITKGCYTVNDDIVILNHVKENGEQNWSHLSKQLNRSRGQVRQRYLFIKKFFRDNPSSDISDVVKRKHTIYEKDKTEYEFLKFIADKYKNVNYIPTLEMIENTLRHTSDVANAKKKKPVMQKINKRIELKVINDVDVMLTEFFSNTFKIKKEAKVLNNYNYVEAVQDIKCLLDQLNVNLAIPDEVEQNQYLDDIDVELLKRLKLVNKSSLIRNSSKCVIPANVNTLVGMRSLVIKHISYKKQCKQDIYDFLPVNNKSQTLISFKVEQELQEFSSPLKEIVQSERQLFKERFFVLFLWPSLFSLIRPNACLLGPVVQDDQESKVQTTKKRQNTTRNKRSYCKKPKTISYNVIEERDEESESELIVTDLNSEVFEECGETDDCEDLTKLDELLKSECQFDESNHGNEEEVTRNDVLLLEQILKES